MTSPKADIVLLAEVADEIAARARLLLAREDSPGLNHYSPVTARADCLRLLRAAIKLAPTLPPQ